RIAASDGLEDGGDVFHVCREGTDAVQGRGESDKAIAGDAAVAAHHGGGGGKGGGPADGDGGGRGRGSDGKASSDDGRGASAGAARNAVERNGILDGAVGGVFVGATHGEFVAIGFA